MKGLMLRCAVTVYWWDFFPSVGMAQWGLPRIHYDNGNLCHCHYFGVVKIDLLFGFGRRQYSPCYFVTKRRPLLAKRH